MAGGAGQRRLGSLPGAGYAAGCTRDSAMEETCVATATMPLLVECHHGPARRGKTDMGDGRNTTTFRRLACVGAAAAAFAVGAACVAAVGWGTSRSILIPRRGDRDMLGNWRISSRYRTLWKPGENNTKPCKQNPWPHRLPGRYNSMSLLFPPPIASFSLPLPPSPSLSLSLL